MAYSQTLACRYLRGSGLKTDIVYPILNQISKWVKNSGEEWTVKRLKAIKQMYINHISGNTLPVEPLWIKHHNGIPSGCFHPLFMLKKPQKAISALMVYTSFVSNKITPSQEKKFFGSVMTGQNEDKSDLVYRPRVKVVGSDRMRFLSAFTYSHRSVRVPMPLLNKSNHSVLRTVPMSEEALSASFCHPRASQFLQETSGIPQDIQLLNDSKELSMLNFGERSWFKDNGFVTDGMNTFIRSGTLSFIQEPGYKLRAVANPFPAFNILLSRLQNCLLWNLSFIEQDCTLNQDKGVKDIQDALRGGLRLISVDLSDATNLFPITYTFKVLDESQSLRSEDLDLFWEVATGEWWDSSRNRWIRWDKGQPLGVLPSFAAFALAHHNLVQTVNPEFYRILGDDIVISEEAYPLLRKCYEKLGCKISDSKTMIPTKGYAEFAGRIITRDRVYVQPKFRQMSDRSFMDLMKNLGPSALGMLPPRQRKVARIFGNMPQGTHPYALGWNQHGEPYNVRLKRYEALIDILSKERQSSDPYVSSTAKDLSDLGLSARLLDTHIKSFAREDLSGQLKQDKLSCIENQILSIAGVTRVESDHHIDQWSRKVLDVSDPRGPTLLSILERKIQESGFNVQDLEPDPDLDIRTKLRL